jgi:uncharacterized protein (DUF983 family)
MDQQAPTIVDASGKPARRPETKTCPQCGAGAEQRVLSAGFGKAHDVCGACGHDFPERTL